MPELPEVETVRRGLEPVLTGHTISRVEVNRPDLRWPFPDRMAERLLGANIRRLGRRSKYILVDLSTDETLIIHLGMSGRILVTGAMIGGFYQDHAPIQKHDHVIIEVENGSRITFNDTRRFGAMDLHATRTIGNHKLLSKLGPEPLGNHFDGPYLTDQFLGRKMPIKSALLDQRIVAGLGNIYVCEALFRAGISPKKAAGTVSKRHINKLVPIIRDVLTEAIKAGGSSLKDFRRADGELGYFQHNFRVYDREDQPCATLNCPGVISRISQSGRSTFYCPNCQT